MAEDFDERLSQMERALKVINTIENNPELQAAAFSHLFGTTPSLRGGVIEEISTPQDPPPLAPPADTVKKSNGGRRAGSKTTAVSQDKTVVLAPQGATSWTDYVTEKAPANLNEKYTVAIYWLTEVANKPPATINQVVYLFIAAKWNLPADPKNKASVAGSAGLIDSGDMNNIKVTALGTALVVNDLPKKKTA